MARRSAGGLPTVISRVSDSSEKKRSGSAVPCLLVLILLLSVTTLPAVAKLTSPLSLLGFGSPSVKLLQTGPRKQNAYCTTMYCGTNRDYEYYIATRVLFYGLRRMRADADLVILVSEECSQTWIDAYSSDGLRVIRMSDIPNPYTRQSRFNHRFVHSLNKLYAWSLSEYNRVVMLDADNIFLQNTDELFQCGDFCAAFIDPCIPHTGLFVLSPSNETFAKILRGLETMTSRDGGDQGYLESYFANLLDAPIFRPPLDKSVLRGNYRLPFGYQMDTSYFYFRLKWRVPCGPNSVMTFPGAESLKPWFWWSWPLLPLGLKWHEERRLSVGYTEELPFIMSQALIYVAILILTTCMRGRFPYNRRAYMLKLWSTRFPAVLSYPVRHPWAIKGATSAYLIFAILLPFVVVPTTVHPVMGWGLYFLGSLAMLSLLAGFMLLPWLPLLTPWLGLMISWSNMAAPIYSHGLPRFLAIGTLAFVSSPFVWWSYKKILKEIDVLIERETLMAKGWSHEK